MSKHKLLLADDSVTIQKVVNLTFADEGIEVISVGDGDSAMEKFVEITPDLVMVDVNMPGVDGYRICEMIKQDVETRHVPVILLVGSFEPFDEEEARRVGANDYLTKPFQSIRQLVNKVTVLLNRDNGNQSSASETGQEEEETPADFYQPGESKTAELGDAGMDDEMIQAKQVGSLPIDDMQRFEGGTSEEQPEADVQPEEPDYSYSPYVGEETEEETADREPDIAKTQPLSSAEFEQITSVPFEQTGSESVDQQSSDEDRNSYLEEQMVSEFATEAPDEGADSAEDFTPEPFETESSYTPEEIPEQRPYSFEEIREEEGFSVEEAEEEPPSMEESRRDYEIINGQAASAEYPERAEVIEDSGEQEPSAPDYFASQPETSAPTVENQETAAAASDSYSKEQETDGQTDQTEETFGETGQAFEQRQDLAGWQTVVDPEEYFKKRDQGETESSAEDFAAAPPELFEQTGGGFSAEPDIPEPEAPAFAEEIIVEPPDAEIPESFSFSESAQPATDVEAADEAEPVEEVTAESNETAEYISEPEETVLKEESEEPAEEVVAESKEKDETAAAEKTHSKVSSLVSSKDTTDAVESVIVSEFARQSISLSSEAIETIASKIADKISEKIVQEMASEVVSDLADLIVARMEQKKLE